MPIQYKVDILAELKKKGYTSTKEAVKEVKKQDIPEEIEKLKSIAKKHDLLISAGSDYHGKNKKTGMKELSEDRVLDLNPEQVTLINAVKKNI